MPVKYLQNKLNLMWVHRLLGRIARDREFFVRFISEFCDTDKEIRIMTLRYADKLKFKQIPERVYLEDRQVYRLHQKVIDRLIS